MSLKKAVIFSSFIFILVLVLPIRAEESNQETTPSPTVVTAEPTTEITKTPNPSEAKNKLSPQIEEMRKKQALMKAQNEELKKARQEELLKKKEEKAQFLEEIRQKREEAKEKFQSQREEFKLKLQEIQDQRKQQIVAKIDSKLSNINERRTTELTQVLEKLSDRLGELETKIKSADEVTPLAEADLAAAHTAIDAAKAAVTAQAGKEYVITLTTETELRNTVGTTVKQLESDLLAARKLTVDAKQAVMKIHQYVQGSKVVSTPTVTSTP